MQKSAATWLHSVCLALCSSVDCSWPIVDLYLSNFITCRNKNEKISVAFSPKIARTRNTQKDDTFGRQRKKQEGQQRHQYEVANKYAFKCRLEVDSDDDDVTNDGKLFRVQAAVTGKEMEHECKCK